MSSNGAASHGESLLDATDIANVLSSTGPIVKCVLLKAGSLPDADEKPAADTNGDGGRDGSTAPEENNMCPAEAAAMTTKEVCKGKESDTNPANNVEENDRELPVKRVVLADLMEEIEIDTTPSKSMVAKTLGGPFTFLGQYEDEGIVLMIRQQEEEEDDDDDQNHAGLPPPPFDRETSIEQLSSKGLGELRALCRESEISMDGMLEKADLVGALVRDMEQRQEKAANVQIVNPHQLQPPLDNVKVWGDILVMKVAATEETLDEEEPDDGDDDEKNAGKEKEVNVPSNDEFFLDYTKEQYIAFASRTDVVAPDVDESEDVDEEDASEEDDDDEEEEGGYVLGEDGEPDEEDKAAMLNLVMNEVLRQYREDNGRGPDTLELLQIRSTVAKQLDMEVPEVDEDGADWDRKANRKQTSKGSKKRDRKIAFSPDTKIGEPYKNDYEDDDEEAVRKKLRVNGSSDDDEDDDEALDTKPAAVSTSKPASEEEKKSNAEDQET